MLIPYHKASTQSRTVTKALYTSVNGQSYSLTENYVGNITITNVFDGYKQPGYQRVIRNRLNATTAASGSKINIKGIWSVGYYTYGTPTNNVKRLVQGTIAEVLYKDNVVALGGTLPFSEIQNSALLGFLKKCKAAQRQFATGVFAGELRETLHLIKKPAAAFRELISDYVAACRREARRLPPKRHARLVANQWLEYSFGMLPLISDIKDAANSLERLYFDLPSKYVTHTVNREYWGYRDIKNISLHSQYVPAKLSRSVTRSGGRKLCGAVSLGQRMGGTGISQSLGLTIRDFVPTVYELIPYSFLVDYFTNIGDVLEAASFNQADILWHSDTSFTEDLEVYSISPNRPSTAFGSPVLDYYVAPSTYTRQSKSFSRTSVPLGLPSLAFKIPGNWSKFLNIGALATLRVL